MQKMLPPDYLGQMLLGTLLGRAAPALFYALG